VAWKIVSKMTHYVSRSSRTLNHAMVSEDVYLLSLPVSLSLSVCLSVCVCVCVSVCVVLTVS